MTTKYFTPKSEAVEKYGEREICTDTAAGRREYFRRTREMAERQDHLCAICEEFMVDPTYDHQRGRGLNGGFRDDRIVIRGRWHNAAVHFLCNGRKGSRKYRWFKGKYVPVGQRKAA